MKQVAPTEFARLREIAGFSVDEAAARLGVSLRTAYRWERGDVLPKALALKELRYFATMGAPKPARPFRRFRFIDLFAGIGGFRRAFESVGGQCVFTSEWDAACRKTYQENYRPEHEIAGDIRQVESDSIPEFDVLVAGFPCQPFSIAGVSKKNALGRPHGFLCDTQGTLFFDVARIIRDRQPSAFLLENVRNLVSHDQGRTFGTIRYVLEQELGYTISTRVIDAKGWVPQHRERIFIAGFRKDMGCSLDDLAVPSADTGPTMKSVLHPEDGSEEPEPPFTSGDQARVNDKYTLTNHLWGYLKAYAEKHRAKGNGFGYSAVGPDDTARTLSARYYKDGSEILVRQKRRNPRRLTPRECARLMGFDGPGGADFVIPVSDTQAYKQFGNSVVVPVAAAVARHMAPHIERLVNERYADEPLLPLPFPETPAIAAE
jgi:DNA (cytosine-5)-methyltransferase 1